MQDTSDERKSLRLRRCKSAMLARELPPSETVVRRTTERLMFDEDLEQIAIVEVLDDKVPSRLRRCKSTADQMPVVGAPDEGHVSKLPRCKSFAGRLTAENDLDDEDPRKLRRCESADLLP